MCGYIKKSEIFHVNIISLSENIAKRFRGMATFLTHTVHACTGISKRRKLLTLQNKWHSDLE